jgi:23S rRNA (pseudouridine1915-N3)-methyltransferase
MYETRLRPANIDVDTQWHKSNDALCRGVEGDYSKGVPVVLLDPLGKTRTSEKLAEDFYDLIEEGGSRLVFVIGGGESARMGPDSWNAHHSHTSCMFRKTVAEGLPVELKTPPPNCKRPILISLSSLTFTHQFVRLVLTEQLYRASEIRKGSGYHK